MGNACTSHKQKLPFEPLSAHKEREAEVGCTDTDTGLNQQHGLQQHSHQPSQPSPQRENNKVRLQQTDTQLGPKVVHSEELEKQDSVPEQPLTIQLAAAEQAEPVVSQPSSSVKMSRAPTEEALQLERRESMQQALSGAHGSRDTPAKENVPPPELTPKGSDHSQSLPPNYRVRRRGSVSAEVASLAANTSMQSNQPRKSLNTERVLIQAMKHNFLFSDLEEEQKIQCISAMFKKAVQPGDIILRQGDDGDNFYVIAEGIFTARIGQPDGTEAVVFTYDGKGAFGELALMYNCPRAATVQAETAGLVWGMDRSTFRRIILASRITQRERNEAILSSMSIFSSLTPGQRASIADCLNPEIFEEGAVILSEGEEMSSGSKFYIVEDGTIACYRTYQGDKKFVKEIGKGSFFGEVALITKSATRAADCIAKTRCKLLAMGGDAFERLMGPAEEVLKKEVEEYKRMNLSISKQTSTSSVDTADASKPCNQTVIGSQVRGAARHSKKESGTAVPSKKTERRSYSLV